jgi:hypothetical protein
MKADIAHLESQRNRVVDDLRTKLGEIRIEIPKSVWNAILVSAHIENIVQSIHKSALSTLMLINFTVS